MGTGCPYSDFGTLRSLTNRTVPRVLVRRACWAVFWTWDQSKARNRTSTTLQDSEARNELVTRTVPRYEPRSRLGAASEGSASEQPRSLGRSKCWEVRSTAPRSSLGATLEQINVWGGSEQV